MSLVRCYISETGILIQAGDQPSICSKFDKTSLIRVAARACIELEQFLGQDISFFDSSTLIDTLAGRLPPESDDVSSICEAFRRLGITPIKTSAEQIERMIGEATKHMNLDTEGVESKAKEVLAKRKQLIVERLKDGFRTDSGCDDEANAGETEGV